MQNSARQECRRRRGRDSLEGEGGGEERRENLPSFHESYLGSLCCKRHQFQNNTRFLQDCVQENQLVYTSVFWSWEQSQMLDPLPPTYMLVGGKGGNIKYVILRGSKREIHPRQVSYALYLGGIAVRLVSIVLE